MKKKSRFLTGLLSAVMALSLFALPASAAESAWTPDTNKTVIDIDETRKGSLTIYKYLQETTNEKNDGTGEGGQEEQVKDLDKGRGVGFTIYKVMNANELIAYYNGTGKDSEDNPIDSVSVSTYVDMGTKTIKSKYASNNVGNQKFTNDNGEVSFEGLDVGLYVVIETQRPANVTEAVTPFLVSIPMTRKTENNQTDWLYNVVVYPKNSTKKGNVDLVKKGVIGDNKDATVDLTGVKFKLEHKKENVTPDTWEQISSGEADGLFTTVSGKITATDLMPGTYRFTEVSYAEGTKDKKYILNAGDSYVFVVNEDGIVKKPEETPEHNDDYETNDKTVTVYNYAPDLEKQVQKNGAEGTWQVGADYSVGDKVPYKITVTVPSNIARLKTFKVTDTPVNLHDNIDDTFTIGVDGTNQVLTKKTVDNGAYDYEVIQDGTNGFKVAFNIDAIKDKDLGGKKLIISYNATLLKDSAVTSTDGNKNTATLIYSNKVKTDDAEETDNDHNKITDETVVYTFKIKIVKQSDVAVNGTKAMQGVKFDLYKSIPNDAAVSASATEVAPADAVKLKLPTIEDEKWVRIASNLTTNGQGEIEVSGLANGTYYLVETQTNKGYNLLSGPVEAKLDIAYKTSWKETNDYIGGVLVKHEVTKAEEKFDKDQAETEFIKVNGGTQNGTPDENGKTHGVLTTTVINRKGFNLPTTGGFGTLLFSGIGALLVVGGIGVLMSIKKKKGNV